MDELSSIQRDIGYLFSRLTIVIAAPTPANVKHLREWVQTKYSFIGAALNNTLDKLLKPMPTLIKPRVATKPLPPKRAPRPAPQSVVTPTLAVEIKVHGPVFQEEKEKKFIETISRDGQPHIYYNKDDDFQNALQSVGSSRAGIIPFRFDEKGELLLLLGINPRGEFTDFGGGSKKGETLIETAFREFEEETDYAVISPQMDQIAACMIGNKKHIWSTLIYNYQPNFVLDQLLKFKPNREIKSIGWHRVRRIYRSGKLDFGLRFFIQHMSEETLQSVCKELHNANLSN